MNVFELYASIILDKGDYEQGLDEAGKKTSEFSKKLKSGLVTAAKIGTAAITAAAAGRRCGNPIQEQRRDCPAIRGGRFPDCWVICQRLHEYRYQLFSIAFAVP